MKTPAFQFYPGDWRKDPELRSVSLVARGLWIELLCLMHESPRRGFLETRLGTAYTNDQLARMIGADLSTLEICLTEIEASGVSSREEGTHILYCRRMARESHISEIRQEAGKRGGNPRLLNQSANQMPSKNIPTTATASQCSSASTSSSATATTWPKTADRLFKTFPASDEQMLERLITTAETAMPDIVDEDLFDSLGETYTPKQTSPGLWLKTLPDYLRRNASRFRSRRPPPDQETRGSPPGPQRIGPSFIYPPGGVYVHNTG